MLAIVIIEKRTESVGGAGARWALDRATVPQAADLPRRRP